MAEQAETPEGDESLVIETGGAADQDGHQDTDQDEDVEVEVQFGDEAAPASNEGQDSGLVRRLRAEIRDRDVRLAALSKGDQVKAVEVGEKPTLEACDFDAERFETELDAWKARKATADEAVTSARKTTEATQAAWAKELEDFGRKKSALRAPDYDAIEEEVVSTLTQVQQAVIIKAAENSAQVIYALGKHPARLAALAAIDDPIKFAVAVVKLEGTLKVTTKRRTPEPEGIVRGSAPLSRGSDKTLERLEAEAERTNDRTKVIAYKRQQRTKARN